MYKLLLLITDHTWQLDWLFHTCQSLDCAFSGLLNNVLSPCTAGRLCVKSVFLENPAPLCTEGKNNYTAVWHKDDTLCNSVQRAHLRSATLPRAKETTRYCAFWWSREERRLTIYAKNVYIFPRLSFNKRVYCTFTKPGQESCRAERWTMVNNVLRCIFFYIPANTSLWVCKFLFRRYYQLLKQTFTRKSPRDAPANTFSGKSCKYHLHRQQHSAQRGAKTRTESHANPKDDMGGKKQGKRWI